MDKFKVDDLLYYKADKRFYRFVEYSMTDIILVKLDKVDADDPMRGYRFLPNNKYSVMVVQDTPQHRLAAELKYG
jgi:hypothetical protein